MARVRIACKEIKLRDVVRCTQGFTVLSVLQGGTECGVLVDITGRHDRQEGEWHDNWIGKRRVQEW